MSIASSSSPVPKLSPSLSCPRFQCSIKQLYPISSDLPLLPRGTHLRAVFTLCILSSLLNRTEQRNKRLHLKAVGQEITQTRRRRPKTEDPVMKEIVPDDGVKQVQSWLADGAQAIMAVTNSGLQGPVARELLHYQGIDPVSLCGRLCFPWHNKDTTPVVHGASRLLNLFCFISKDEFLSMNASGDMYSSLADTVARSARSNLRPLLPADVLRQAVDPTDPGANPADRKLRFTTRCRVNGQNAEKTFFGDDAEWATLKQAVREGVQQATGWILEARSSEIEIPIVAFFGLDHLAIGVECLEPHPQLGGPRFGWADLDRPGMETQLAGAMAALALEPYLGFDQPRTRFRGVVIDPACGMGTLLLASSRLLPIGTKVQLIGRDLQQNQYEKCIANFEACHLDSSDVRLGDARIPEELEHIADSSADAFLCDLPSGGAHKASSGAESYQAFLTLAARVLRPGGRCVLLSIKKELLKRLIKEGPWTTLGSWSVGRGEGNYSVFFLVVLERQGLAPKKPMSLEPPPARKNEVRRQEKPVEMPSKRLRYREK